MFRESFAATGRSAAEFGVGLGLAVCVVERGRAGGDCLWTGCIPSKALIAAADAAHSMRTAHRFGPVAHEPQVDLATVWARIRAVQETIATGDDNPARFIEMGIDFHRGDARVTSAHEVTVRGTDGVESTLTGRAILLCSGSQPTIP